MHYINVIPLVLKTVHLQYKYKITRNVTVLYLGHQTNTHYITLWKPNPDPMEEGIILAAPHLYLFGGDFMAMIT